MKEMWNQRYAGEDYAYGKMPNEFFKEKLEALTPGRLLLPAEGEGRNAVFAARLGWQVYALDFSEEGRKKAMKLAGSNGVEIEYTLADITQMDFGRDTYDAAALIYAHMPPGFRKTVHSRIIDSLKPGAVLILEGFNPAQLNNTSGGPASVEMLYTVAMLREDFKDLEILLLDEMDINLDQGEFHQGKASIIRFFGKKKV